MAYGFDADKAIGFCATCPGGRLPGCGDTNKQIRKKCKVEDNSDFRRGRQRIHDRLTKSKRKHRGGLQVRNKTWKDDHCGALLLNPNMRPQDLQQKMDELVRGTQDMKDDLLAIIDDIAPEIAKDMAVSYGQRALARQGAAALCGPGAAVCTGAMAIWNIASGLWSAWSAWDEISSIKDMVQQQLGRLNEIQGHASEVINAIDDPNALKRLQDEMVQQMQEAVTNDACLQARRCFLVPYTAKEQQLPNYNRGTTGRNATGGTPGLFDIGPFNLSDSRGCCPGQTGHHLIPESWLKDGSGVEKAHRCTNYNHGAAPTACVEGYDGRYGSHGEAHSWLNETLKKRGAVGRAVTTKEAIDLAVEGYTRPGSVGQHCDKDCIREQLERYYGDAGCANIVPKLQPGLGGDGGGPSPLDALV